MQYPFYHGMLGRNLHLSPYYDGSYHNDRHSYVTLDHEARAKEMERYRRWKERQEEDELRERQKAYLMERTRQQQKLDRERMMRRKEFESPKHIVKSATEEPNYYTIVRGNDGRMYRVSTRQRNLDREQSRVEENSKDNVENAAKQNYTLVRGNDGRWYQVPLENGENDHNHKPSSKNVSTPTIRKSSSGRVTERLRQMELTKEKSRKTIKNQKKSPRCPTVLVEDASDSERDDDNDLKSIWRNRRPSPGQWMEPVEN